MSNTTQILASFYKNLLIISHKQDQEYKDFICDICYQKYFYGDQEKLQVYHGFDELMKNQAHGIMNWVFFQQVNEHFEKLVSFSYEYRAALLFEREIKRLFYLALGLIFFGGAIDQLCEIHTTSLYEAEASNDGTHQEIAHYLSLYASNGLHFQAGFPQTIKYYRFLPSKYNKKKKNIGSMFS